MHLRQQQIFVSFFLVAFIIDIPFLLMFASLLGEQHRRTHPHHSYLVLTPFPFRFRFSLAIRFSRAGWVAV